MHFSTTVLAGLGLASSLASAHMVMTIPKPFNPTGLNNSPLAGDGSDYPCKKSAGYAYTIDGGRTPMALGSSQPLQLMGSAVHGGGSCQISITYDLEPDANSEFKVIHSWESGCPMDIEGNNGNSPEKLVPNTFTFVIPTDLPPGDATIAWSWLNRVGNREMYMNCAPITITGGSVKRDARMARRNQAAYEKLPNIFKANIGNGCTTVDNMDVAFPDPGDFLEITGSRTPIAPVGNCGGSPSAGSGPGYESDPPAVVKPKPSTIPNPSNAPILIETGTQTATQTATQTVTSSFVPSPTDSTNNVVIPPPAKGAPAPYKATPETTPETTQTTTSAGELTGPCTQEGAWNCFSTSFQRCSSGRWSVKQDLAAGMECKSGQGMDFSMSRKASP